LDASGSQNEEALLAQGRQQVQRYFPVMGDSDAIELQVVPDSGAFVLKIGRRPIKTKLAALWESLDYSAPLWLNALGIALLLACRVRPLAIAKLLPSLCP